MKMTTRISMSVSQLLVVAAVVASWTLTATEWHKKTAAELQVRADAATINGLNRQFSDSQKAADGYSASLDQCQTQLAKRVVTLANSPDPDFVTVIASQIITQGSPAPALSANPAVAMLGNLIRPGLGDVIARMGAPSAQSPAQQASVVRWVVAGKVTPYIAPGDSAVVEYAWLNVKTNAVEVRQPDPAGVLIQQLQQQAAH
jgi:hypothetical protein